MKKRVLIALMGTFLFAAQAFAQQKTVTGKVTDETGAPLAAASVVIKGTSLGTQSNAGGSYTVLVTAGQVLQFRLIGHAPQERTVGAEDVINVVLKKVATSLNAMVVTALGETNVKRALGSSQQQLSGADIAQTNRENFINALAGRVAGVEVTSTSGVPGASTTVTIRGVSSLSGSNQPLMIIDGLPLDNKTMNTGVLISDLTVSTSIANRNADFSNRGSDINPADIETMTVLKGPEASALYGIDAANGAIVITTKRGKAGTGGFEYSNFFRMERTGARPELQKVYGPSSTTNGVIDSFNYWGTPYPAGTTFYDNIDGFFRTALTQNHNLSFSGAAPDNRVNYRVAVGVDKQAGIIPNSDYGRVTLTGASQAVVTTWLKADLSMTYSYTTNDQPYRGTNGPLIGLLLWPQTDNAKDWLTPGGLRRRITNATATGELDNPYFNLAKNRVFAKNNRILTNLGLVIAPFNWGNLKTNIGVDNYTNGNLLSRNPESVLGYANNGLLDAATDVTRNLSAQTLLTINSRSIGYGVSVSGVLGNAVADYWSVTEAEQGINFMDPNFISINNSLTKAILSTASRRRVLSAFGSAQIDYQKYLYVTVTGRNDWTSTIPPGKNSFFYPSITSSFIFSDAFPSVARWVTGKLRAGYAEVGKDTKPYAYAPALQAKTTSYSGFGYDYTGPNPNLKPEFTISHEYGAELSFLDDRLGLDVTYYRKQTRDQIITGLRPSYGSGFVLLNINAGSTRNEGTEITLRGTPVLRGGFSWDFAANFDHSFGRVVSLPATFPEFYNSDTWLYGNVRTGAGVGMSTRAMTGYFYLHNNAGKLLIDPSTGRPVTSTNFIDGGFDRQPKWTMGLINTLRYQKFSLNFLLDFRRGGDVFNATQHYLTTRGLSMMTLDREVPRIVPGVLRDGKENTANPTVNTIVIIPAVQTGYYSLMSEEVFMEKNINWVRLRDVTLRYQLPGKYLGAHDASVFVTGTDLFLKTNYSGLDPIVNGNSAALGGAGGAGIDWGNFPMPKGFSFGIKVGF